MIVILEDGNINQLAQLPPGTVTTLVVVCTPLLVDFLLLAPSLTERGVCVLAPDLAAALQLLKGDTDEFESV